MDNQPRITFNEIDLVIKAPRFKIIFSYMDEKGIPFVPEFVLRLLKINDCNPEHIASYFDFTQIETEIALQDLANKGWITWHDNGTVGLSSKGNLLFDDNSSKEPKIPSLQQRTQDCHLELLDKNFIPDKRSSKDNRNALELAVLDKDLSESKAITKRQFQIDFRYLKGSDNDIKIIEGLNDDTELYKIDLIEKLHTNFFRVTQRFEINPSDGIQLERNDMELKRSETIQQTITETLANHRSSQNNLSDIMQSMESLQALDTLQILVSGKFDFSKFLDLESNSNDTSYFVGQIYHQDKIIKKIEETAQEIKNTKQLTWIAPSDYYWGKQAKIIDMISEIADGATVKKNKEKTRRYNFKLYLPLSIEDRSLRNSVRECKHQFQKAPQDNLYGVREGFLKGNTEIIVLEDMLAIVCYHVRLPDEYDVTLPIGFMTTDIHQVKHIATKVHSYLNTQIFDDDCKFEKYDLGIFDKL